MLLKCLPSLEVRLEHNQVNQVPPLAAGIGHHQIFSHTINTPEGGTHEEGFRAALTVHINRYAR